MSHRLCAVSSDYCSVCQNGLLPSAAATASNPLWPLAAPFLMTNCQPAPTKARLKCQHRMTKGPRGSSETNCVQYELILYSRAGAWLAAGCSGCWLASERMQGRGWPCRPGLAWGLWAQVCVGSKSLTGPSDRGIQRPFSGLSIVEERQGREVVVNLGCGMGGAVPTVTPGSVPDVHSTISETIRAATKTPKLQKITSHREMVVQTPECSRHHLAPCPEP